MYFLIGDRFAESKTKAHDTQQSLWNVNRVDQPLESTKWLNQFRTMNMKHLNEVIYHLLVGIIVAFSLNRIFINFLQKLFLTKRFNRVNSFVSCCLECQTYKSSSCCSMIHQIMQN